MKLIPLLMMAAIALPGCAATQSALGALTGTKPNQVTVVTTVEPAPAAPAVVTRAPDHARLGTVVGGGFAGAVAGGLVVTSLRGSQSAIASGALVGAGLGAAIGYLVDRVAD